MSVYRQPSSSNIDTFFAKLTISLSTAVNKFDNLIIMGDFNIDITKEDCSRFHKLEELCDTRNLHNWNWIKRLSRIDINFIRSFYSRLKPKIISFRNYKTFDETKFLADLKNTNFYFTSADPNESYLFLTNKFSKNVPIKKTLERKSSSFCF